MRRTLTLVPFLILISGCGSQTSRYEITNSSDSALEDVHLTIGDDKRFLEEIGPGKQLSFSRLPLREEEVTLAFIQDGNRKSIGLCYQTFLLGARNIIVVKNDDIERRCEA